MDYPARPPQGAPRPPRVVGVRRIRAALVALGIGGALAVSGRFALAAAHGTAAGSDSSSTTGSDGSGLPARLGSGLGLGSGATHATTSGS